MKNINDFKKAARGVFENEDFNVATTNPIEFLYSIPWNMTQGPAFDELELSRLNLNMDTRTCFGKAVRALVLAEKYFSHQKSSFYTCEVLEDALRNILLSMAAAEPTKWNDVTFIDEILQYEAPHTTFVCGDQQMDPLFVSLAQSYGTAATDHAHAGISKLDAWNALWSAYLVSAGILELELGNVKRYSDILEEAALATPDMLLVKENQVHALSLLGRTNKALELAHFIHGKRKDVKFSWYLWSQTKDELYKSAIICEYDERMFSHLENQYGK